MKINNSKNSDNSNVWAHDGVASSYLDGVRAAIPFAQEEIEIIFNIINHTKIKVSSILDIGCGDGILGRSVLSHFPSASATFSDMSSVMIDAVKSKIKNDNITTPIYYHKMDMADILWNIGLKDHGPFDVIVSGFAIHHLTHSRKNQIYAEIYDSLSPEGIFINLDRVESHSSLGVQLNTENYINSLFKHHQKQDPSVIREDIAEKYFYEPLKQSNILAPIELQTKWLRELGYIDVDIFFKIYEIAIFGGRKRPLNA